MPTYSSNSVKGKENMKKYGSYERKDKQHSGSEGCLIAGR